jgi:hypothetical protein
MAAKKNRTHATPPQTPKARPCKNAPAANDATEAPACAEMAPTQTAQTTSEPAVAEPSVATPTEPTAVEVSAESSGSPSPTPAEESTTTTMDSRPEPAAPAGKLSALDAAAKLLGETGQAMSCPELIAAMAAKGYWQSPKGRTPASTLYSALLRELHTKGEQARFVKAGRGKFALCGVV